MVGGSPYEIGLAEGGRTRDAISSNVQGFWRAFENAGLSRELLTQRIIASDVDENRRAMIEGMSVGSGVAFKDLLGFNLLRGTLFPDECTMMMALGDSTASGNMLYMKNSDKVGGLELQGSKYHMHKEINVIRFEKHDNGTRVIGIGAAGGTGYKMAMNDKGVASGSNIARTTELKLRRPDLTKIRAIDRAELLRLGMKHGDAVSATKAIVNEITENPMATPGNIHFTDTRNIFLVEGSYDRVATLHLTQGVAARANSFVVMKELNDPDDISSKMRYSRASKLLTDHAGNLTPDDFIRFSQDHENGPSLNSICRHNEDFRQETSLSAAVMEIDRNDSSASIIRIALGKPCHAWKDQSGNIALSMKSDPESIPPGFRDGTLWKEFYTETPFPML